MYTPLAYCLYIIISIFITIFVSRTLSKNGEIYLIDGFNGNEALAKSINHMLVVGFYLLNLGFVLLKLENKKGIHNVETVITYVSANLGFILIVLGCAHFFNMFVIHRFRDTQIQKKQIEQV